MRWTLLLSLFSQSLGVLFGTSGRNGKISHLWVIDTTPTSGGQLIGRDLGPIFVNNRGVTISGLAFDRRNRVLGGTMYALVSHTSNYFANFLIEIDLETALGTIVGNTQLDNINGLAISNIGTIYGWHQGSDPNNVVDKLVKLNEDTGRATTLRPSGLSTFAFWSEATFGMDFDRITDTNIHFLTATCLYAIVNTATGVGQEIGYINNSFYCGKGSIDPDAMTRQFWSLEVDQTSVTVNVNTQLRIVDLDALETVKVLQTNIDQLETIAFTYDTTEAPSVSPSALPSDSPSSAPSSTPSASPSAMPSSTPSMSPSGLPSSSPSMMPSSAPSASPSGVPSRTPSSSPSGMPSMSPSGSPTSNPSAAPSAQPSTSRAPSAKPSSTPSVSPSAAPSPAPSSSPSVSRAPSASPTEEPSCFNQPCTYLFFLTGNFVHINVFGVCTAQCVDPLVAQGLELVGWTCGDCP